MFKNKTLWLHNLKTTRTAVYAKISMFFCVEAIKYLLLYNLHDLPLTERKLERTRSRIKIMLSASPSLAFHTKFTISNVKSKYILCPIMVIKLGLPLGCQSFMT